jgi:hypothetical protein
MKLPEGLSAYMKKIGRKGGRQTSLAKALAVRANSIEYRRREREAKAGRNPCDDCSRLYPCEKERTCGPRKIFLASQREKGATP